MFDLVYIVFGCVEVKEMSIVTVDLQRKEGSAEEKKFVDKKYQQKLKKFSVRFDKTWQTIYVSSTLATSNMQSLIDLWL